jgi:tRNA(Ile)-lysidine synthase
MERIYMNLTKFEYDLLKFIRSEKMILPGDKIVLAVSGGADSVAMMYALASLREELKADFFVAHLNHMIRPEAEMEGPAVCAMAKKLNMECLIGKKDVLKYQMEHKSLSLEEAARVIRYAFFEEALRKFKANKIATAHHLSDLSENFFIRLFRGSGIGGLVGMRAVNGKYIKPFLFLDEESIREYVTIRRLEFFEDKTNEDVKYLRNNIRHRLIPFIKSEFCPDLEEKVRRTVKILEGYQDFVRIEVQKIVEKARIDDEKRIFFDLKTLNVERLLLEEVAKDILRRKNIPISSVKIEAMVNLIKKTGSGQLNLGKGFFAVKYDDTLMIGKKPFVKEWKEREINVYSETFVRELSLKIKAKIDEYNGYLGDGIKEAIIDAEKVKFPLFLRSLRKGEKILILGMNQEKDAYSVLKDKKVPFFLRNNYPVVSQADGKIAWIVGVGISDYFKVTARTKRILVLSQEGGSFFKHA